MEKVIAQSHEARDIICHQFGEGGQPLLLIGGVHGDEPEGFLFVERFMQEKLWPADKGALYVLPRMNPDGCVANQRQNSKGVDLNRNMATKDWNPEAAKPRYFPGKSPNSEPETKALISLVEQINPALIISVHSWEPMINYNGDCLEVAKLMATYNNYRISDDIGYPTPGSLGTWAGWEREIPTITLEIERGLSAEKAWELHKEPVLQALLAKSSPKS